MTEHVEYRCPSGKECGPNCMYCDGGLFCCTVCGGAEGTLPTDCPGEEVSDERLEAIMAGKIDFVDGKWVTK